MTMFDFKGFAEARQVGVDEVKTTILDRLNHLRSDLKTLRNPKMDKWMTGAESMREIKLTERVEELKYLYNKIKENERT